MKLDRGFSLIELVIVISIIAVLIATAWPLFLDLSDDAKIAAEIGEVTAIRSGITLYGEESHMRARDPIFPPSLDNAASGPSSPSNPLFSEVLATGMTDGRWEKVSAISYTSPDGKSYTYDSTEGSFTESSSMLTPLGSTVTEITGNMITLIQSYYDENGSWPRSWGDYRFTDLGLDPEIWNGVPYEGVIYGTGGSRLSMKPDQGWEFTVNGTDGVERSLTADLNWSLWYDMNTSAWYYHSINPTTMIDISTLQITPP